jgi:hypothetical protein
MKTTWFLRISLIVGIVLLGVMPQQAKAEFMIDTDPGGEFLYNNNAVINGDSFTGIVGSQSDGPQIDVTANASINVASGYATIKPATSSLLTSVTFTPFDDTAFGDFSFRGQLNSTNFDGKVYVTVMDDNQQQFNFTIAHANQDFARIGITAVEGTGETIDWVKIWTSDNSGFKEVKQIQFSLAEGGVTVPEPTSLLLLGLGLIGVAATARRKMKN